ncbi:PTS sugar transporter subunit IIA [Olsenella massiliensis]|uniref:PTS sugar transporter subunit IIA n=1 Tax=Olsenella massiliensis TaxID=1622075 RepID=UPI00071E329B|nr:PTS sugar transporter subunit IIA [Olsenella massiliensis]
MRLIAVGHGRYASGLKSAVDMLSGDGEKLSSIDFAADVSPDEFERLLREAVDGDEAVIICDLVGGTPYNRACLLAHESESVRVVAGMNLAAALEAVLSLEDGARTAEIAERLCSSVPDGVGRFEEGACSADSVDEDEDL